jgi:hypothetical protein
MMTLAELLTAANVGLVAMMTTVRDSFLFKEPVFHQ